MKVIGMLVNYKRKDAINAPITPQNNGRSVRLNDSTRDNTVDEISFWITYEILGVKTNSSC